MLNLKLKNAGLIAGLLGVIALAAGCGSVVSANGDGSGGAVDDTAAQDLGISDVAKDSAVDIKVAETAPTADVPVGGADAGSQCPGGQGCECKENGDCNNAQCIEIGAAKVCATKCVDKCEDGYKCALINGNGGDSLTICVPKNIHLCDPCVKSKDCQSLGMGDSACVAEGGQGNFCGTACSADSDCTGGYACQSVNSVEGAPIKQCVKASSAPELKFGECTCSPLAIAQKAQTSCFVEHKNDKGELTGKCAGVRACAGNGLTTCAAPALDVEVCDGKDNDCDGLTDEATCDGGGSCNVGTCDPLAGCQYNKLNNVPCDADKNACTENDQCKQGVCVPGVGKMCDDGNPCTTDSCDAGNGCVTVANDGKACDADGNACTAADHCVGSVCTAGKPVVCDNTNVCSKATCDAVSGKCVAKAVQQGAPCDDGTVCTQADHCQDGDCTGKIVSCDDNNPCTGDGCDAKTGCNVTNLDGIACDDDNPCTVGDLCKVGVCNKGVTKVCEAGAACVSGSCNLVSGKCDYKNKITGAPCNDGDACSENDGCDNGTCQGKTLNCDDANPCTNDSCDNKTGCGHVNNTAPCSDGDACTQSDGCIAGLCVPGPKKVCEDNTLCTADSCNKTSGNCVYDAIGMNGTPCDDFNVCTLGDACKGGVCAVGIVKDCNDNNPCTDDLCDKVKGCNPSFNSKACDDGNACTTADICQFGDCEGKFANCFDGNPCTDDSCDPKIGCVYGNNTAFCSDNNPCTTGDACKNSICGGAPLNCDDGNVCSDDSCDKLAGCVATPNVALCPDSDKCTTGEVCKSLNCVKKAVVCDDGNECTLDTCNAVTGCAAAKVVDKTLCAAGAKWCIAGICQAKQTCGNGIVEAPEECDDGNLVDNDACSNACKAAPLNVTFSNCAQLGATGPNQAQCDQAYAGQPGLVGKVTIAAGIQKFTIPSDGTYRIEAYGAEGGKHTSYGPGGTGARVRGDFDLKAGEVLAIMVGQRGADGVDGYTNAAGGGTFVAKAIGNTPLVVAGGGGTPGNCGAGNIANQNGSIAIGNGAGGTSGNDGGWCGCGGEGSGGGGFTGNGGGGGGMSFTNGGIGCTSKRPGQCIAVGAGGFGGGGNSGNGGGGGGGYQGGQAGGPTQPYGYGGLSFNSGLNPSNSAGVQVGQGKVILQRL